VAQENDLFVEHPLRSLLLAGVATVTLASQSDLLAAGFCTGTRQGEPPMVNRLAPEQLGTVSFANSCRPTVQADFNRGVALLHSFWLDEAERMFRKVAATDPDCAMAGWGIAMSDFNEVNGGPTTGGVVWAKIALKQADNAREKDPREAAYIHALHRYFDDYTEKDSDVYAKQYTDAMAVYQKGNVGEHATDCSGDHAVKVKQVRPWLAKPRPSGAPRVRESEGEPISKTHQGQRLRPQQKSECTVAI